jgi:hypothetical protein
MPYEPDENNVRRSILIGTGIILFLFYLLLCYARELGPPDPKPAWQYYAGFLVGLAICVAIIGAIDAGGHPPGERGFGFTLVAMGGTLFVLTLIAWGFMGPTEGVYYTGV